MQCTDHILSCQPRPRLVPSQSSKLSSAAFHPNFSRLLHLHHDLNNMTSYEKSYLLQIPLPSCYISQLSPYPMVGPNQRLDFFLLFEVLRAVLPWSFEPCSSIILVRERSPSRRTSASPFYAFTKLTVFLFFWFAFSSRSILQYAFLILHRRPHAFRVK